MEAFDKMNDLLAFNNFLLQLNMLPQTNPLINNDQSAALLSIFTLI
jgi:hypothetical protein